MKISRYWNDADDTMLRALWPDHTMTLAEIGKRIGGRSGEAAKDRGKRLGLSGRSRIRPETSSARDALLREIYLDRSLTLADVLARSNALPGNQCGMHWLRLAAARLGLARDAGCLPGVPHTPANPEGRVGTRLQGAGAVRVSDVPIVAPFAQVHEWAVKAGVEFCDWDDLRAVNRKRDLALLAWFARPLKCHARIAG